MDSLLKKIDDLTKRFLQMKALLDLAGKEERAEKLKQEMSRPDFWSDRNEAAGASQEAENLSREIAVWKSMEDNLAELAEYAKLAGLDNNADWTQEAEKKLAEIEKEFAGLEFQSLLSGRYDRDNALVSIHAGTGGVDAQDWTAMLERMYLRFSERQGWRAETLDRLAGNEAGLKSVILRFIGPWAYGYLKSENGVHRLLRNSPFNADGLRQTSFALVEVVPELEDEKEITVKEEDLRFDVFRSSGPGGQSVNTTDSAVRLVHLPTGLTVSCQSERSQRQNKENALKILKAKLYQLALQEKEEEEKKLKGETQKAEWGRQIRSYFLYGNRLVKDHRSEQETSAVEAVLDGDLKPFMEAYLRWFKG